MSDIELVEEFLSKKNLDGIDKFLLEKYMGAIENLLHEHKKILALNAMMKADLIRSIGINVKNANKKILEDYKKESEE